MFELMKLLWDIFVLRDARKKGQMGARMWFVAAGFVLFLYGTGLPVAVFYDKYPQYRPLFIGILALDVVAFVWFMIWGLRRYLRQLAAGKSGPAPS